MNAKKRILKVQVKHETDMDFDGEDTVGTFDMESKSEYAIPLEHWDESRGYRYDGGFKFYNAPVHNYKGEKPEDIKTYVQQDYAAMKAYNAGEWQYIGIRAVCEVQLTPQGPIQTLRSGGLWGVESGPDTVHIAGIEREQLDELKTELTALGFSKRAIAKAFQNIERKDS